MAWVKKYAYDPWGRITSETARSSAYDNLKCPYGYAGYFYDTETGLYCMPARYYSPAQRRFLTRDPHPGSKSNPLTLNPYQYCENNPVNKVDPTGQFSVDLDIRGLFKGVGPINYKPGIGDIGDAGVGQIAAGAALANEGIRRVIGGLRQFNAGINAARAGMRSMMVGMSSMMGGLGTALGGMNRAVAGVSSLAGFNWGSMAAVGIRGGRTEEQAAADHAAYLEDVRRNPWPPQTGISTWGRIWRGAASVGLAIGVTVILVKAPYTYKFGLPWGYRVAWKYLQEAWTGEEQPI